MNTNTNTNAPAAKYAIRIEKMDANNNVVDTQTLEFVNVKQAIIARMAALKALVASKANGRVTLLAEGMVTRMIFRAGIVISTVTKYVMDAFNAVKESVVDFWNWIVSLFSTEEKAAGVSAGAEQKAAA